MPPPRGPNSFNFMLFMEKFGKYVCWRPLEGWHPHRGEILDLPLTSSITNYYLVVSVCPDVVTDLTSSEIHCIFFSGEKNPGADPAFPIRRGPTLGGGGTNLPFF